MQTQEEEEIKLRQMMQQVFIFRHVCVYLLVVVLCVSVRAFMSLDKAIFSPARPGECEHMQLHL
jgi:hypothetical protein